jgi:glucokinase
MPDFSIGVDLGGTNLRVAAIDEPGNVLGRTSAPTQVSRGRDHVIAVMCDAIRSLKMKHVHTGRLLGVGVGVPGIIDPQTGCVREAPNLPGWTGTVARAEIEKRLGEKVIVDNDANAAALGEKWLGAAREFDDMAIFTLGTGVGGGLVLGGKVWRGLSGVAGEFGHIIVEPEGIACTCGGRGCLEQYASATAIVQMAHEGTRKGSCSQDFRAACASPDFSAQSVCSLAIRGDEQAKEIFRSVGRWLAIAVADLVNSLNLPIYVIGGGVSNAWEVFAPSMFEELRARCMVPVTAESDQKRDSRQSGKPLETTIAKRSLLGADAGIYGAARLPVIQRS